ncbi:MAG: S1 family peptidase [Proteobacteria bacterium]|nr:S1 family peptidase [Pseudomonadota bacterium]
MNYKEMKCEESTARLSSVYLFRQFVARSVGETVALKSGILAVLLAAVWTGCVVEMGEPHALDVEAPYADEGIESRSQGIYRGPGFFQDVESTYPEFVVVNIEGGGGCSGVMLGSQVVLFAGHCWHGGWIEVTRDGIGKHYVDRVVKWGDTTNDGANDVMIGHLSSPIYVGVYPEIEPRIWVGDKVTYLGRIDGGVFTNRGHGIRHRTVSWIGSTKAQTNWGVLQRGDSGGPVLLDWSHRLIGINSYIYGDRETPGSLDGFTRLHDSLALSIQQSARDFGGPGTNVRIHWGR